MNQLRIQTASRLHFGLLGWGPQAERQFGGVGLMIEAPGIEMVAVPATKWSFAGALSNRVQEIVAHIEGFLGKETGQHSTLSRARIEVISAPAHHVGLGVGTQLGLAVVRLVEELAGVSNPSVEALTSLSGRGRRSGIGLHGFLNGGLVVDGGRRDDVRPPPLVARLPFPEEWSILIVQPPGARGRHGPGEIQAFDKLPPLPDRVTERLCRLVLLGMLPAVVERDLTAFGQAVTELQHHVGSAFAPFQGGNYASQDSGPLIAQIESLGLVGAGQSSWGPTIYAFGAFSEPQRLDISSRIQDRWGFGPSSVFWTRAANHGAVLDRVGT